MSDCTGSSDLIVLLAVLKIRAYRRDSSHTPLVRSRSMRPAMTALSTGVMQGTEVVRSTNLRTSPSG
eukprot:scaffold138794_cov33-Prasinocladus_malaysianus.AAC.1